METRFIYPNYTGKAAPPGDYFYVGCHSCNRALADKPQEIIHGWIDPFLSQ